MKPLKRKRAKILIADDHPLFRSGLAEFIHRQTDLLSCAEVANATQLQQALTRNLPDLLLLDLRLGTDDGLELIKSLRRQYPGLSILIISQSSETIYGERAMRAGARGYVMKEVASEEILAAIETVLRGELYASRALAMLALQKTIAHPPKPGPSGAVDLLSDRELEVFERLGHGRSTRQIAAELNLSVKTVETHRENIKHKMRLHNAAELKSAASNWVQHGAPPPHRR